MPNHTGNAETWHPNWLPIGDWSARPATVNFRCSSHATAIDSGRRPARRHDQPVDTFVRGLLGAPATNLIPERIDREGTGVDIGQGFVLPLLAHTAGEAGGEILYGVRPQHLHLTALTGI